jgi:alpha-beta hydrolase superfamily lysophospholipase
MNRTKTLIAATMVALLSATSANACLAACKEKKRDKAYSKPLTTSALQTLVDNSLPQKSVDPELGAPYTVYPIEVKPYDKVFHSTLIEYPFGSSPRAVSPVSSPRGIVLYVHGYNDYFFQKEMAQKADSAGYAFFAIDLHYCGRSFAPGDRRGDLRNMREFFPELDFAVELARVITKERTGRAHSLPLVLIGHSQGGLLVSFYAESRPAEKFAALVLNSPFFDFNFNWLVRNVAIPVVSELAMYLPDFSIGSSGNPNYAYAINRERYGEWQYNTEWKSEERPEQFLGWIRGVHRAQLKLHKGFHINSPVLVLHGDCSEDDDEWSENQMHCDGVLDVEHIEMWAPKVGTKVTTETVAGGLHDLYLSRKDVRDEAYAKTFNFIDESLRGLERAAD